MNAMMSLTRGQVWNGATVLGTGALVSMTLAFGILSARAAVRIVSHWDKYPPQAKKIQTLSANMLFTIGYAALTIFYASSLVTRVNPAFTLLSSTKIDILAVGGFLCCVAGAFLGGYGKNEMPNLSRELRYWDSQGSLLPMNHPGYQPDRPQQ